MNTRRLATGGQINRTKPLAFEWDGKQLTGYEGDSLASALLASGETILGRSFKYHRPRGVYSMCAHDANVMLENGETLNIRGDTTLVEDGMDLTAVNTVGSLRWDLAGLTDRMSGFLPVGFYYKAFHTPNWMFPNWERMIRDIAGLGNGHQGIGSSGLSRRQGERGDASFHVSNTLFQHIVSRIHDPRIDVTQFCKVKEIRAMLCITKRIRCSLVNWDGHRVCGGVRGVA